MKRFHFLNTDIIPPQRFTYPFNYTPHPLCIKAVQQLREYIGSVVEWKEETEKGKMFGVLVVRDTNRSIGFLAAYSGLLAGRNDLPYFVPPVYDSQQPDGYFKTHEREISAINDEIKTLQNNEELISLRHRLSDAEKKAEKEIAEFKALMAASKDRRDELRKGSEPLSDDIEAEMIRESQYQKAELKRIRKRNQETIDEIKKSVEDKETAISHLKKKRKTLSDSLQHWLFRQYDMLNAKGEHRNLCRIFADTPQGVPPSGAGDCCAPKLLQYAYKNSMSPLCMAEFWWGQSPKREIRHHLHFYPACRSKCKPILGFMLQGLDVDPDPHDKIRRRGYRCSEQTVGNVVDAGTCREGVRGRRAEKRIRRRILYACPPTGYGHQRTARCGKERRVSATASRTVCRPRSAETVHGCT